MFFLEILSSSGRSSFRTCFKHIVLQPCGSQQPTGPGPFPPQGQRAASCSVPTASFSRSDSLKKCVFLENAVVFSLHCTQKMCTQHMIFCLLQQHPRHLFGATCYDGKEMNTFTRSLKPSCCIIFLHLVDKVSEHKGNCATF